MSTHSSRTETASATSPLADPGFVAGLRAIPTGSVHPAGWRSATDIQGVSPSGQPIALSVADAGHHLLLAFLHSDCDGCADFWDRFGDPTTLGLASGTSVAIVTRGPGSASSAEVAKAAAAVRQVPVIMSDQAWLDYRVLGYPLFVLVETVSNRIIGETVGIGWDDVVGMTRSATRRGTAGTGA